MQNPVFYNRFDQHFPKPGVFAIVLARFGFAAAQWIAARAADFSRKACKKLGSAEKTRENTGFCTRDSSRLLFFLHILVAKESFHKTFLVHLPFRGATWTPPQLGQKMVKEDTCLLSPLLILEIFSLFFSPGITHDDARIPHDIQSRSCTASRGVAPA